MTDKGLKARILAILDQHRVMAVATVRSDGWPQATLVGYVHDDLILYFVVARTSQKLTNIERDPRVSIAIGGHERSGQIRGLSMAAHVSEVMDVGEILKLNELIAADYPEQALFAPRAFSSAVMRAAPTVVSLTDDAEGRSEPLLFQVATQPAVDTLPSATSEQELF